jgi:hypothetical protein
VKKPPHVPARPEGSQPEIIVAYKPAGRATLDAIADELVPLPIERQSSSPEIIVHEGMGPRDAFGAIVVEARSSSAPLPASDAPTPAAPTAQAPVVPAAVVSVGVTPNIAPNAERPAAQALEIFEMMTYVVRGGDVARLSSESARRAFVEEHLLARLPVVSMAEVERVDVTPWTVQGTLVVRVWCRTGGAG